MTFFRLYPWFDTDFDTQDIIWYVIQYIHIVQIIQWYIEEYLWISREINGCCSIELHD